MAQLTVKAGRAYMVTSPEREAAVRHLGYHLSQGGVDVDVEITHYLPGRRGLPPPWTPEDIAIFIGSNVVSGLIGAMTADAYNKAKQWGLRRYEEKRRAARDAGEHEDRVKGERFVIFGPNGRELKSWTVDKDGEHETDGE